MNTLITIALIAAAVILIGMLIGAFLWLHALRTISKQSQEFAEKWEKEDDDFWSM